MHVLWHCYKGSHRSGTEYLKSSYNSYNSHVQTMPEYSHSRIPSFFDFLEFSLFSHFPYDVFLRWSSVCIGPWVHDTLLNLMVFYYFALLSWHLVIHTDHHSAILIMNNFVYSKPHPAPLSPLPTALKYVQFNPNIINEQFNRINVKRCDTKNEKDQHFEHSTCLLSINRRRVDAFLFCCFACGCIRVIQCRVLFNLCA